MMLYPLAEIQETADASFSQSGITNYFPAMKQKHRSFGGIVRPP
jgi:hypothetical protein